MEEYLKELEQQKEERQIRLEEKREQQLSNLKCIECGGIFKGTSLHQKLCSTECGRVRRNKQQRLCKDKRINDDNNIDKDISLEILYKRDRGICYICVGVCIRPRGTPLGVSAAELHAVTVHFFSSALYICWSSKSGC